MLSKGNSGAIVAILFAVSVIFCVIKRTLLLCLAILIATLHKKQLLPDKGRPAINVILFLTKPA